MYKRIVLAYDGSTVCQQALIECKELAQWSQAALWLVAVMPPVSGIIGMEGGMLTQEVEDFDTEKYRHILKDGLHQLASNGFEAQGELLVGEVVHEVSDFARTVNADLIVVGHKHLDSWAARWWRGKTSGALIEHSPCSVLCVIPR